MDPSRCISNLVLLHCLQVYVRERDDRRVLFQKNVLLQWRPGRQRWDPPRRNEKLLINRHVATAIDEKFRAQSVRNFDATVEWGATAISVRSHFSDCLPSLLFQYSEELVGPTRKVSATLAFSENKKKDDADAVRELRIECWSLLSPLYQLKP